MKTNEGTVNANTNNIDENSSTFQRQRTEAWQASCIDNDSVDPKLSDNLSTKQKSKRHQSNFIYNLFYSGKVKNVFFFLIL